MLTNRRRARVIFADAVLRNEAERLGVNTTRVIQGPGDTGADYRNWAAYAVNGGLFTTPQERDAIISSEFPKAVSPQNSGCPDVVIEWTSDPISTTNTPGTFLYVSDESYASFTKDSSTTVEFLFKPPAPPIPNFDSFQVGPSYDPAKNATLCTVTLVGTAAIPTGTYSIEGGFRIKCPSGSRTVYNTIQVSIP